LAVCLSQPLATFAVSDMGNSTRIQDIDISLARSGYELVASVSELPCQELGLSLVEFTTQAL
jgi:hypothetical protein